MKNDFISEYKKYHGLDDKWEEQTRKNISQVQQNKINNSCEQQKKANFHGDCDHINSLENVPATIVYILVMIFSPIFNNWWILWAAATCIWVNFITRHTK